MKIVKATGRAPVRLTSPWRHHSAGEIIGVLPAEAVMLVDNLKVGLLEAIPDDIETEDSAIVTADEAADIRGDHEITVTDGAIQIPEDWQTRKFFWKQKLARKLNPNADVSNGAAVDAVISTAASMAAQQ